MHECEFRSRNFGRRECLELAVTYALGESTWMKNFSDLVW